MTSKRLPARGIEQARLAELLDAGGCPVCHRARDAEDRLLASIVNERATDVVFQRELAAGGGLCAPHAAALPRANRQEKGGTLATAILHGAVLAGRLGELGEARRHRGGAREKRLRAAGAAAACPVCERREAAVTGTVAGLLDSVGDPGWASALAGAPLCVEHLGRLMLAGSGHDAWHSIEVRQLERLAALRQRLADYVHHSSHDRRHLLTDEERAAVEDATRALAGLANRTDL